jgi:pyruvate formate lyase activating enzyme
LLIPGENDSDAELDAMTRWLVANLGADVPLHFSAFHPDFRLLDHSPTPLETLRRARDIARQWPCATSTSAMCRRRRCQHLLRELRRRLIGRDGYALRWALPTAALHVRRYLPRPIRRNAGTWGNRPLAWS